MQFPTFRQMVMRIFLFRMSMMLLNIKDDTIDADFDDDAVCIVDTVADS